MSPSPPSDLAIPPPPAGSQDQQQICAALETLCNTYGYPIYLYIRSQGQSHEHSQDLTQDFSPTFSAVNTSTSPTPNAAASALYLLSFVKFSLADPARASRAQKRGGAAPLSFEIAVEDSYLRKASRNETPARIFARRLDRVISRLLDDFSSNGRREQSRSPSSVNPRFLTQNCHPPTPQSCPLIRISFSTFNLGITLSFHPMKLQGQAILWHRWLGIATCLLFIAWFISGIVMMYAKMPVLTPQDRLAALPPLNQSKIQYSPAQAWQATGEKKPWKQATLTTIIGRPAYRFTTTSGERNIVFADNGQLQKSFSQIEAETALRLFLPPQANFFWQPVLTSPDQWTVQRIYTEHLPLYHAVVSDRSGTGVYISSLTGEVILSTTTQSRLIAWIGAIPHWLYLRAVRVYAEEWRLGVIYISAIGSIMALLGIAVGIWRYSPSRKYRNRELGPQPTPYLGAKKWHHYSGLVFGLLTFTFILSGMLSLNPGRWSTGASPTSAQLTHFTGGPIRSLAFDRLPTLPSEAKEVELLQINSQPLLSFNKTLLHLDATPFTPPATANLIESARSATGGATVESARLLTEYETYYYDRKYKKPLPVLEVKLSDAAATWFYIDPSTGLPVNRYESTGRWERWLYHGLHSLDFPGLWNRRPLWDIIVIFVSLGGVYLSWSGIQIGWVRLRQKARSRKPIINASARPENKPVYVSKA